MRFAMYRAIKIMVGGSIAVGLYLIALIVGPVIETRFFPVTIFTEVAQQRIDAERIKMDVAFSKKRSCEYKGSQWYVGAPKGSFEPVIIDYHNGRDGDRTRPLGRNYDEDWELSVPKHLNAESAFMVLSYRCGLPWLTQTIAGPFPLPK